MKIVPSNRDEWLAAACAVATGLLLYASFAPLEWTWGTWVALVPLFVMARRRAQNPVAGPPATEAPPA